ncbi:alpha-L-rhamnosidase [Paenarthrobacter sp. AB444]|uniref:alpha-L-rhamnosidase n=1 Tax=Paenarthrobacter sp. AB444 TaxID=3025681 RepID=UPI00236525BA|nr:alpha-L-rhamnosidase [Paenarthrobacter sp. AB444]MDD7833883.1 family 78 glycoside hydrolase catalytic domain [Paenarthrobacter sp. AB444]
MTTTAVPSAPRFEHFAPTSRLLGVGTGAPRLSWSLADAEASFAQRSTEVEVTTSNGVMVYRLTGQDQILIDWPAPALGSREAASVRLRVSDGQSWGPWGATSSFEVGLLDASDWSAEFISPVGIAGLDEPAPIVERSFQLSAPVRSARLYATAHGIYRPVINGSRLDDSVLAPGWTSYDDRLRYFTYDVTEFLQAGDNTFSTLLGNGWYRGYLGYMNEQALYGDRLALCAQLEITTVDGETHCIATDASWTAFESQIVSDDLYNGQTTDFRRSSETSKRVAVEVVPAATAALVAPSAAPVRPTGQNPAATIWTSPSGRTLVDFGQNAVGWVRLRVSGLKRGSEIVVRHAEVLEGGELGTRPLRSARATDTYIMAGEDEAILEPELTLHGFRYAEITGVAELKAGDITQVVVGTDLRRTGWFQSSNALLNQLHENVIWSTRGNFIDIPTDCPQRNERLGWTGDLQIFAPTAQFLYDVSGLVTSWLADLAFEQYEHGGIPHVIPNVNRTNVQDPEAAAWGDAATIVPWTLYQRTADVGILRRQMPSMRAWVDRIASLAGPSLLWNSGFQFGDWLDPNASPHDPADAKAAAEVVATAHFARSAWIVSQTAEVIGDTELAEHYRDLAHRVRQAFAAAYVTPSGRVVSEAQTTYALALEWNLLPSASQRAVAAQRLADMVRIGGFRIATGFVGTPLICDALINNGYAGLAYRLLLQTDCPSWLYPVTMGATTIWERWDSMLPDGSINPGEMTSFNHYALGAVADTLHRTVAGLAPAAPGYRRVRVAPLPPRALSHASARHVSPFGEISVAWERADGKFHLTTSIPAGVQADVEIPGSTEAVLVSHGVHTWTVDDPHAKTQCDLTNATIRDLIDHEDVWNRLLSAMTLAGLTPRGESQALRIASKYLDRPATDFTFIIATHMEGGRGFAAREHPIHAQAVRILRTVGPGHAD